jgi:Response regulator containing CheY-like receiver domain and AraC-type DNA-binding domain
MIRVMIADDDVEMLQTLGHIIDWEAQGFRLMGYAADPQELIDTGDVPDVLITDITMPAMDGFALAQALKARNEKLRVVFLTCHDDFTYAHQAIHLHADDYLLKYTLTSQKLTDSLARVRRRMEEEGLLLKSDDDPQEVMYWNQDVRDVTVYVKAHLNEEITLESVAAHVYKNSSYLSRLFKRVTGKTFSEYLIGKRAEKATRLLVETDLPIEEICKQIGIENIHYFYRFYKRETGQTPGALRKSHRQERKSP